jgi:protein-disulfide isomerase
MKKKLKLNKAYLAFALVALIILAFIVLSLVNFFKPGEEAPRADAELIPATANETPKAQSYAVSNLPALRKDDKFFGLADAPLKIFVYEDYTNIFSASLADTMDRIKAEAGDQIAVVIRSYFKDAPLALKAAAAVDCAGEQGKWVQMRALLFARAKNHQSLTPDFSDYIKQLDLNGQAFAACLTNAEKSGKIEKSVAEAETFMVQGTPTIFVGDEMIIGARPYGSFVDSNGDKIEGLKAVVDKKLPAGGNQ